jgi:hypothetical protein
VYWTDTTAATVWRVPIAGGAPEAIVSNESGPIGLVISSACLYFANFADGQHAGSIKSHDLD